MEGASNFEEISKNSSPNPKISMDGCRHGSVAATSYSPFVPEGLDLNPEQFSHFYLVAALRSNSNLSPSTIRIPLE